MSEYLNILHNKKLRNVVSNLRLSSHRLTIESGRHIGIERQNRKFIFCSTMILRMHIILICPRYSNLRMHHIKRYYYRNPSMLKFIQFRNSTGKTL